MDHKEHAQSLMKDILTSYRRLDDTATELVQVDKADVISVFIAFKALADFYEQTLLRYSPPALVETFGMIAKEITQKAHAAQARAEERKVSNG
jgi:hypothetical protein